MDVIFELSIVDPIGVVIVAVDFLATLFGFWSKLAHTYVLFDFIHLWFLDLMFLDHFVRFVSFIIAGMILLAIIKLV